MLKGMTANCPYIIRESTFVFVFCLCINHENIIALFTFIFVYQVNVQVVAASLMTSYLLSVLRQIYTHNPFDRMSDCGICKKILNI